jgi:hypothetical protein
MVQLGSTGDVMATEIETFYYQRYIPEEKRGGTYHGVLNVDGVVGDPKTPAEMDALGFPLSNIFADIDMQLIRAADDARADAAKARAEAAQAADVGRAVVSGVDAILQDFAARLSEKDREEMGARVIALNETLKVAADPVKVAPIDGVKP